MSNCPKCGRKLTLRDISQYCPDCGTNIRFYGFVENFSDEAKKAELSQALTHVKIKRLKAALIGSKLNIVRLVVALLPLVSLLLSAGSADITLPFRSTSFAIGALGIYQIFTDGTFGFLGSMTSADISGAAFSALQTAIFAYAAVAVFAVLVLLLTILCFISIKNMQKIIMTVSALGIPVSIAAMVLISKAGKAAVTPVLSVSGSFGLIVTMVMFAVVFAINLILQIKGIPVQYDEGMLERSEIAKKVKRGEVNLDDLPQPIVETEATRKIEEEVAKERENYLARKRERQAEKAEKTEVIENE